MIDYSCTDTNIKNAFTELSQIVDSDDMLFVWIDDHGMGYIGLGAEYDYYGFLYPYDAPFFDPGDEQDYLEHDFKLRSYCVYGDYYEDIGMNIWKVVKRWNSNNNCYEFFRLKYVNTFSNIYFESLETTISDNDVFIEQFIDYLKGDFNRDGYINTGAGEIYDYDGDGIQPYNYITGVFDEGDWVSIHHYGDDITHINTGVPQSFLKII